MNVLNCAVIGVGYLGNFHAQKYHLLENAKLVGVCDTNQKTCQTVASTYQVPAYYDYQDLLGKVDAVSIATTTPEHYSIAKCFLEHGVHVLLEKPITETVKQANELISIAKKYHAKLQVGHLERFNPVHQALSTHLHAPIFIESQRLAPFTPRCTDTNVVLDLMIHDIDLILEMVKSPIIHIEAQGAPIASSLIDVAHVRLTFENHSVAHLTASRISTQTERMIKILQAPSYLAADYHKKTLSVFKRGETYPAIVNAIPDQSILPSGDALMDEIKAFLNCIQKDSKPVVTGEEGRDALNIAERITSLIHLNALLPNLAQSTAHGFPANTASIPPITVVPAAVDNSNTLAKQKTLEKLALNHESV